jgi:hypothetical protein
MPPLFIFGGAGAAMPGVANVAGATIVEQPAGTRIARRLFAQDVDPNFAIASFAKTAPNTNTLLYRRGDTVTGITASLSYTSGPPDSVGIANAYGGSTDGGDVDPGSWTCTTPFTSASLAGSIKRSGSNAGADPTMTVTATATRATFSNAVAVWTLAFTSDIYWGTTTASSIVGTDVFNGSLQSGWNDSLQQDRHKSGMSFSGTAKYHWFLIPNQAQYTTGFNPLTSLVDSNNQPFAMTSQGTVSITRNGVTRTYNAYRTDLLNETFTVAS